MSSIFDQAEFTRYAQRWATRQRIFAARQRYYDGTIYEGLGASLGWLGPRIYRGTKALYLPLSRAVDVDAGVVPGGWKLAPDAPAAWASAMKSIFSWSDWATDGVLYVHYGAQYGMSGLKIADLRSVKRVVLKPVDPTCFMLVPGGQYDPRPSMAIWIEQRYDDDGEQYEYAEVITPDAVRTFAQGEPAGVDGRAAEYRNPLGFVPFVEVEHIRAGAPLGECTYQKAIPLLDEVNELASYLADIIKKHAEPQWVVIGGEAGELVKSGDNVWFAPAGSDIKPLVAGIDIAGVLSFIESIAGNVRGALPELSFEELRSKDKIATATLELQLMELVIKMHRCRPNYDHGLADGLRMCGQAAETMNLGEIAALNDEALALDAERPVLPLDPETALRLELQALQLERERALDAGGVGHG